MDQVQRAWQRNSIEKSADFTAELHGVYLITATCTVTDPTPAQGHEYICIVRNGTATIGGSTYIAGQVIWRSYHSGAWSNTVEAALGTAQTFSALQTFSNGLTVSAGTTALQATTCTTLTASGSTLIDLGTGTLPSALPISGIRLSNADSVGPAIQADSYSATGIAIAGRQANGTRSSPSATLSGSSIVSLLAYGYDTSHTVSPSARFILRAGSLWSATNRETDFAFLGTPSGSTTASTWAVMNGSGFTLNHTTTSTSTTTGALVVSGGVGIAGKLWTGSDITIAPASGDAIFKLTAGTASFTFAQAASNDTVIGTTTNNGVLFKTNGSYAAYFSPTQNTTLYGSCTINSTTASTSTTTGALVVSGGVGVAGGLWVGGQYGIKVRSVTSAAGTTTLDSTDYCAICTGTTTQTFTLPACSTGRTLIIKNRSTGTLTVNRAGSDTIDGGTTISLTANQSVTLVGNTADWTVN